MSIPIVLHWFRRDLRLHDNAALFAALRSGLPVLPVFIFDTDILSKLEDESDRRVDLIHRELVAIKKQLEALGSSLYVHHGTPADAFEAISSVYDVKAVYANRDYEPYARHRDAAVEEQLKRVGARLITCKDQVVFECSEVLKDDGTPYTVFTPYSKRWLSLLTDVDLAPFPSEGHLDALFATQPLTMPSLADLGFAATDVLIPPASVSNDLLRRYHEVRDLPAVAGTSRMGVHLRFGMVSIRALMRQARTHSHKYMMELVWRDFYQAILWHFPHVDRAFKPAYDRIRWETDEQHFIAWCEGRTGYPLVDAGMRELNATGHMHNRVRMVVASFLCKHLLLDWRWGEAYFARKLLDFDLASNNGGWQWASGSGCDGAPYFRVFNPTEQARKFDPDMRYIRKWVKELDSLSYPHPIVEHTWARDRALTRYREALKGDAEESKFIGG